MESIYFDQISLTLAGLAILIAAGYTAHSQIRFADIPGNLPWVGKQSGFLADLRTRIGTMGNILPAMQTGYDKYSKAGINFILPIFDVVFVLLPRSQINWIINQPDEILSSNVMQIENMQADWTLLDKSMARNPIHAIIIRRDLTRSLGALIPDIEDELSVVVDETLGTDSRNWKEVEVFKTAAHVVARTSNRVFVGLSLCRNDEYLANAAKFANDVAISGILIRLLPEILKPLLAWIILLPNRYHLWKCGKFLFPFIKDRMARLQQRQESGEGKGENDFTTWYLEELAANNADPLERTPEKVVKRLMTVNFAAIHTSTFTATNMLFDLIASHNAAKNIQELREEIQEVLAANNGKWDKNAVAKLIKVDSAIRESLRISTFMTHGMDRLVIAPEGIDLPDGSNLPRGSRIGTSTHSIHLDPEIYSDPEVYDPFRFSRLRSQTQNTLEAKNLSIVTTSDTFLSFGHGRHACPGRFFAATEMKLLLAYIILNYDIKALETRPPNTFMGSSILPPLKATISVRRRKI